MKKLTGPVILFLLIIFIAGCTGNSARQSTRQTSSNTGEVRTTEERSEVPIDIDFTIMSTTLMSAEMTNIYNSPDDYLGKTIRASGTYSAIIAQGTDTATHYIITIDGDDCCQEGFEFRWSGNRNFPRDFPNVRAAIEIEGVFSFYRDNDRRFFYIAVDDIFLLG